MVTVPVTAIINNKFRIYSPSKIMFSFKIRDKQKEDLNILFHLGILKYLISSSNFHSYDSNINN